MFSLTTRAENIIEPEALAFDDPCYPGVAEYGVNGSMNQGSVLKIIGPWRFLLEKDNAALFGGEATYTTEERSRLLLHCQQGIDPSKVPKHSAQFDDYPPFARTDSEIDFWNSNQQPLRPNSRLTITELSATTPSVTNSESYNMLRENYLHSPVLFNEDILSGKYPLQFARSFGYEERIDGDTLRKKLEAPEHYSERANYEWLMDGVAKHQPFLLAFQLNDDERSAIEQVQLAIEANPNLSAAEVLSCFSSHLQNNETLHQLDNHWRSKHNRYAAHISGLVKPDGDLQYALTGTGKEVIILLMQRYNLVSVTRYHKPAWFLVPYGVNSEKVCVEDTPLMQAIFTHYPCKKVVAFIK